jgi:acyl-CoA reductase-like NAD-dependent aldehyde dehydrogenase
MIVRDVQRQWAELPVRERVRYIRRLRHEIASRAAAFASCIARPPGETLVAEVLPLADACRFVERRAAEILAPRDASRADRPFWLTGVKVQIRREPLGVVLVIGPANYPLFLPAVQAVQALTAGNAVIWKPGRNGFAVAELFIRCCGRAGVPQGLITVTKEEVSEVYSSFDRGVDKVILTGSAATGKAVLQELARNVTPAVMELSGCDPVIVWRGADLDRVVKALRFGIAFNGGDTCIAPRRMIVFRELAGELRRRAADVLAALPVEEVGSVEEAVASASDSEYALGATVFGDEPAATQIARRLRAGLVVINDMIVPTADPRVPFGGRGQSGFGTTRGLEGLLEMTSVKAVVTRHARWLPHLEPQQPGDAELFASYVRWAHAGGWKERLQSLAALVRSMAGRERAAPSQPAALSGSEKDEVHEY